MISQLEQQVRRLADVEAIRRVLIEYGRTLDAGDAAGYADLFALDGEWSGGPYSASKREGIRAMAQRVIEGRTPGTTAVHFLSNMIVEVDGDTAKAWSRWMLVVSGADGAATIRRSCSYDDQLVRSEGRWKFARRVVSHDVPFTPK
jgi:uncharacterized protein (TIGR02246 family)